MILAFSTCRTFAQKAICQKFAKNPGELIWTQFGTFRASLSPPSPKGGRQSSGCEPRTTTVASLHPMSGEKNGHDERNFCGAPRGQRGTRKIRCTASITSLSGTRFRRKKEDRRLSKYVASPLECGGRGGIRTPGLLIANEEIKTLRCGATTT